MASPSRLSWPGTLATVAEKRSPSWLPSPQPLISSERILALFCRSLIWALRAPRRSTGEVERILRAAMVMLVVPLWLMVGVMAVAPG